MIPNEISNIQNEIGLLGIYHTGSSYICNPPVLDTDKDYLILVEDFNKAYYFLQDHWIDCMPSGSNDFAEAYRDEKQYGTTWNAFRSGEINIMVSADTEWFLASIMATERCRIMNILDKKQRIRIFRYYKYGEPLLAGETP